VVTAKGEGRAVFLDRDGVINRSIVRNGRPYAPLHLKEFEILPGVPQAIEDLRVAGLSVIVVTNQPDVGAGHQTRDVVEAMHEKMCVEIAVDAVKVCYHTEANGCDCRKPLPGMLLSAAEEFDINLDESFMVGDRWRDVDAGHAAGCRTYFIDRGYDEALRQAPNNFVADLPEAVRHILSMKLE
jgi:D-glycero-D-manno-heptose 1,7-bisphosphate phosphatase